ncbi:acyltransferase family protein [Motilibacter deserti]|uniref:Acyltransferase n=1 Tax=Motilibacter deserti TaxID=2714956 RepID=A0ABX0H0J7_9ACTN|nr:acyltransferase [Motilibacter deserti]NHC15350.1 acyltransferase [Motilibacter deserti]
MGTVGGRVRRPGVDGARALACLMVLAFHSWEFAGSPSSHGLGAMFELNAGVDLFMILSGFCLMLPLLERQNGVERFDWRTYLRRRVRRIAPPYYAAIAYAVALPAVLVAGYRALGISASWQPLPSAADLFTHLTFTHSLFPEYWNGISGSFWSLGLEMQFYLLFPLLVLALRRRGALVLALGAAASVAYRVVLDLNPQPEPMGLLLTLNAAGRLMEFCAGALAAVLVARTARQLTVPLAVVAGVCIAGGLVRNAPLAHLPARELLLSTGFAALLALAARPGNAVSAALSVRWLAWLGFVSYSVFLLHQQTLYYFQQGLEKALGVPQGAPTLALELTVGLALVLAVSWGFHRLVELPFMRPARRPLHARPAGSASLVPGQRRAGQDVRPEPAFRG